MYLVQPRVRRGHSPCPWCTGRGGATPRHRTGTGCPATGDALSETGLFSNITESFRRGKQVLRIRIRIQIRNPDPRGQKLPRKNIPVDKFHLLKCWIFLWGLKAFPVTWTSFMDAFFCKFLKKTKKFSCIFFRNRIRIRLKCCIRNPDRQHCRKQSVIKYGTSLAAQAKVFRRVGAGRVANKKIVKQNPRIHFGKSWFVPIFVLKNYI